jgi:hypothetical protein
MNCRVRSGIRRSRKPDPPIREEKSGPGKKGPEPSGSGSATLAVKAAIFLSFYNLSVLWNRYIYI